MEEIFCKNATELRKWLEANHSREKGIWLVSYKGKDRTMTWEDVVRELLCFGWIDGKARSVDSTKSKIWISPRKPKSGWSAINKAHIENLTNEGRMHESGIRAVQRAKENGSWSTLDSVENLEVPEDLNKKLKEYPSAYENFMSFPRSAKRIALLLISSAKTDETRTKRVNKVAELASKNLRIS